MAESIYEQVRRLEQEVETLKHDHEVVQRRVDAQGRMISRLVDFVNSLAEMISSAFGQFKKVGHLPREDDDGGQGQ